jgi:hypothetical protein
VAIADRGLRRLGQHQGFEQQPKRFSGDNEHGCRVHDVTFIQVSETTPHTYPDTLAALEQLNEG